MSTFGERLSKLRLSKGLSQSELAERLNIAKSTLAMYETDKREPSFETAQRIADFFEVSIDYLVRGVHSDANVPNEQLEFLKWVEEKLTGVFFYDFDKAPEQAKEDMMDMLKFLWEKEKNRRPGQKQGE